MNKQTVTVQLTLDDSSLYFRDLGELLSRHVSELCSKGNFGHDFAAGIYRALSDQLENAEFDGASPEKLEHLARKGFDETMYGPDEQQVTLNIQTLGIGSGDDDDDDRPWSIQWKFRDTKEGKRLQAILEKYVSVPNGINSSPMRVLADDIVPRVEDFRKAQSLLCELAASKGLRTEKSKAEWKRSASVDEIMKEEDKILFYGDVLTGFYWERLITNCLKYSVLEASEVEIADFVTAYGQLPDGFQSVTAKIDSSFLDWVRGIRDALDERLSAGMFIDDIKAFGQDHGLSDMGIQIKNRVEHLVKRGVAVKGRQKGKVFFTLVDNE